MRAPTPTPMEKTVINKARTIAAIIIKAPLSIEKVTGECFGTVSVAVSSVCNSRLKPLDTTEITAQDSYTERTLLKPARTTSMMTNAGNIASKGNLKN